MMLNTASRVAPRTSQPRTAVARPSFNGTRAAAPPRSRRLPACRAEPGGKQRLAADFDKLIVEKEGQRFISVDALLEAWGAGSGASKQELAAALEAAVQHAQDLRAGGAGGITAATRAAAHAVSHAQRLHDAHAMDLKEMLDYASNELEPKAGPSPAMQLAMRQLRDRITDKLEKHVSSRREVEDLRRLIEAQEACEEAAAAQQGGGGGGGQ